MRAFVQSHCPAVVYLFKDGRRAFDNRYFFIHSIPISIPYGATSYHKKGLFIHILCPSLSARDIGCRKTGHVRVRAPAHVRFFGCFIKGYEWETAEATLPGSLSPRQYLQISNNLLNQSRSTIDKARIKLNKRRAHVEPALRIVGRHYASNADNGNFAIHTADYFLQNRLTPVSQRAAAHPPAFTPILRPQSEVAPGWCSWQ